VYRDLFERFTAECVQRIHDGECLSDDEATAFVAVLDARERAGRPVLGALAGPDGSFDTVSGRCGLRPRFRD
jgi:hypothetical protein